MTSYFIRQHDDGVDQISNYLAQNAMSPSLGFVTDVFFSVDLCYILWSVLLYHLICIAPFDLYCTI